MSQRSVSWQLGNGESKWVKLALLNQTYFARGSDAPERIARKTINSSRCGSNRSVAQQSLPCALQRRSCYYHIESCWLFFAQSSQEHLNLSQNRFGSAKLTWPTCSHHLQAAKTQIAATWSVWSPLHFDGANANQEASDTPVLRWWGRYSMALHIMYTCVYVYTLTPEV